MGEQTIPENSAILEWLPGPPAARTLAGAEADPLAAGDATDAPTGAHRPVRHSSTRVDPVFVRDGRRHHRRSYSWTEFRVGIAVLVLLAAVLAWVAWRGAHPDPELFATGGDLLTPPPTTASTTTTDRGPLPSGIAAEGWKEGPVSTFDADNLYEKINGREDYYKSFGFRRLWFVSLVSEADPEEVVDIEMYDLSDAPNALGAYAGERAPGISPVVNERGLSHVDRNALYLTRGSYYVRAIGTGESPSVRAQLAHLERRFDDTLAGEPLPWAYALFVGCLGLDPGRVSYQSENAFSFGFARDVYSGLLADDETEGFVVAAGSAAAAESLALRFTEGFRSYGSPIGDSDSIAWTRDRYLGSVAGATPSGAWTLGIRGAPDLERAESSLRALEDAVRAYSGERP